ncbi:SDR family oxidoreductase [Terasakiella pusilla]|jgi:NAD(P)-dependent dehydrogenase (short-subunit alcohol dehydrogenase family)|uniref:SDR family oxidoreductase n=1 Tax=Terasakiella pusilla TaxID=64973 RepID=UPI00048C278B|nr:SDR family oxidoreductase [Terasakiella pusilla]
MRVALVTGAAQRIGAHIASTLAEAGWAVAIHYHGSSEKAEALADQLRAKGGVAEIFSADFSNEDDVQHLLPAVQARLGLVSCLINNASVFENDTALTASKASWDLHMGVNLRAPFVLCQHFARQKEGVRGNIINIVDQRVWNLTPHFTSYTLSKAALWTLTQTLALALSPHIRVNAIGPGPTLKNVRQTEADFQAQYEAIPLKKPTDLMDISNAVLYILSAQAMTGQMITLDGGEHLGWAQGDNHTPPRE